MNKVLVLPLLFITSIFAYTDLGTYGKTFEIKEKNFKIQLKEQYEKVDKVELENKLKNSYKDSFIIKSSFENCTMTKVREYEPIIKLDNNVKIPFTGEDAAKAGEYNILKEKNIFLPYNIMFIDADDELQVELAKVYKMQLRNKIRILVAKGDYAKLTREPLFEYAKVARETNEAKAFNLKCLPSIYTQKENKFIINEYKPKDLIKDEN